MATAKSPEFVFVHGSWHTPEHLGPMLSAVRSKGYSAVAPLLPSCDVSPAPNTDTTAPDRATAPAAGWPDHFADAKVIQDAIKALVDQGKRVVVVAHSYGGVPASEAVTPELTLKQRQAKGQAGGVAGMFFMNAYLIPSGKSVVEWLQNRLAPCAEIHPSYLMTIKDPGYHLFNDMPEAEQAKWSALLRPQPLQPCMSVVKNAGFMLVPCFYYVGTKDQTAPQSLQESMMNEAREAGAQMQVYTGDTSHSPYLSWVDGICDLVVKFSAPLAT